MKKERKVNLEILGNLIYALVIEIFFIFLIVSIKLVDESIVLKYIKICSMVVLAITIFIFEKAYKKDSGSMAVTGMEFFLLSILIILLEHISCMTNTKIDKVVMIYSYSFAIYYVIKSMIIYTKYRKEQLDSLSDITDIVKDEPIKKEPTKKEEKNINENLNANKENKNKKSKKTKKKK